MPVPVVLQTWFMIFSMDNQVILLNVLLLKAFVLEHMILLVQLLLKLERMLKKSLQLFKRLVSSLLPLSVPHLWSMLATCIIPWPTCSSNHSVTENCCLLHDTANAVLPARPNAADDPPRAQKVAAAVTMMMMTTTNGTAASLCGPLFRQVPFFLACTNGGGSWPEKDIGSACDAAWRRQRQGTMRPRRKGDMKSLLVRLNWRVFTTSLLQLLLYNLTIIHYNVNKCIPINFGTRVL